MQSRDIFSAVTENRKLPRTLIAILVSTGCSVFLILAIEGFSSFLHVAHQLASPVAPIGKDYAHFDPELGWVNAPNVYIEDLFGPRIYFRSNSQGFRNNEDFSKQIPPGKFRIVCSGDSFTMGFGVDNDHAWCQLMSSIDGRLQAVNMGETAYGIDQAYLWYARDGVKLDLNLHILAFIDDDFARMTYAAHWGLGKPVLAVENDNLVVRNVPVPRHNSLMPMLTRVLAAMSELRTAKLLRSLFQRMKIGQGDQDLAYGRQLQALPLAFKVFENLQQMHAKDGAKFIIVYLPSERECLGGPENDKLHQLLRGESQKLSLPFWDLTEDCQQLPGKKVEEMFFGQELATRYHLTEEGNQWVASLLYKRMMSAPDIANYLREISAIPDFEPGPTTHDGGVFAEQRSSQTPAALEHSLRPSPPHARPTGISPNQARRTKQKLSMVTTIPLTAPEGTSPQPRIRRSPSSYTEIWDAEP